MYVLVACYSVSDPFGEIRPSYRRPGPDPDSCSLWAQYIGDLKTAPWDDLEIRTSSCSEDQKVIQFYNLIISCECLFLCHFFFTVIVFYSYYFMRLYIIFYQFDLLFPSWDIIDCSPYWCSWYELVSVLFHVLEMTVVGLGLVLIYRRPDLIL